VVLCHLVVGRLHWPSKLPRILLSPEPTSPEFPIGKIIYRLRFPPLFAENRKRYLSTTGGCFGIPFAVGGPVGIVVGIIWLAMAGSLSDGCPQCQARSGI